MLAPFKTKKASSDPFGPGTHENIRKSNHVLPASHGKGGQGAQTSFFQQPKEDSVQFQQKESIFRTAQNHHLTRELKKTKTQGGPVGREKPT